MRQATRALALVCLLPLGCASEGGGGEPLIAGSITGEYEGATFVAVNGFAIRYEDLNMIAVGDGNIGCGSVDDVEPPSGINAVFSVPTFEVGTYDSIFVNMYYNRGDFEGRGSGGGSVTITASTPETLAGTVAYTDFDEADSTTYAVNGGFEVIRCP